MRVVFMGSPAFALPSLRRLIERGHEIAAVFTQPDRPVGRGRKLAAPPVKELALRHNLTVHQPKSISSAASVALLRDLRPDIGVIAAYGQILKQPVLDVPRLGVLNVHASLLPRWRGAAPVAAAILAGDAESGATIMRVVRELDAGPMLAKVTLPITPEDTTGTLTEKIAEAGASLLVETLARYAEGGLTPEPQDDTLATYAPQIEKTDARIEWARDDAVTIARHVRAYNPWPMAYSFLDGQALRIVEAFALPDGDPPLREPGTIVLAETAGDAGFAVATHSGWLAIERVQPPGGRVMSASAFLRGHREIIGKRLMAAPPAGRI